MRRLEASETHGMVEGGMGPIGRGRYVVLGQGMVQQQEGLTTSWRTRIAGRRYVVLEPGWVQDLVERLETLKREFDMSDVRQQTSATGQFVRFTVSIRENEETPVPQKKLRTMMSLRQQRPHFHHCAPSLSLALLQLALSAEPSSFKFSQSSEVREDGRGFEPSWS